MNTTEEDQEQMRVASLSDPKNPFYLGINRVLAEADARERLASRKADRVVIPFPVSVATRTELERRFKWKIACLDSGARSRMPEFIAALIYCMSLRNTLKCSRDGSEVISLDEDVSTVCAKTMSFVHVCRTSATIRLRSMYALDDAHLLNLTASRKTDVALSAVNFRDQLAQGGGPSVCVNAAKCRRSADVLLINHARTPCSLAQAVSTARAHGAEVIEGECFFQPDMLISDSGSLEAFPGTFVVDRQRDELCYIPDEDPSMSFSHPYSSLMSFFLNHEYVDKSGTWIVEKGLSMQGVYSYVIRKANSTVYANSERVTAHYYPASMSKVTKLEFPKFDGVAFCKNGIGMIRASVNIYTDLYNTVMGKMLAMELKDITPEAVMIALKDRTNTVVVQGDVVKRPKRMMYSDECDAAVVICAQARWRKMMAAGDTALLLTAVKARYSLMEMSAVKLISIVTLSVLFGHKSEAMVPNLRNVNEMLDKIDSWMFEMQITKEEVDSVVSVTREIGTSQFTVDAGPMHQWLPGLPPSGFQAVLARAKAYCKRVRDQRRDSVELTSDDESFDSGIGMSGSEFSDASEFPANDVVHSDVSERRFEKQIEINASKVAVENLEHSIDIVDPSPTLTAFQKSVVDKLAKDQDALNLGRIPRVIERYEGPERSDAVLVPTLQVPVVSAIQTDYDRIMPGVSDHDAEIVPYLASESDFSKSVDANFSVNVSKREIAKSRVIRRSKVRTGGVGSLPKAQTGLLSALFKRNAAVPPNRGYVDLDAMPKRAVDRFVSVCFVEDWEKRLANELENGLWQPVVHDLETYVPKITTEKAKALLDEFFSLSDVDFSSWLLMTKGKAKPPVDTASASKVPLPQTIMYNESSGMNAYYSSQLSRVHTVMESLCRPEFSFNSRDSPAQYEKWFNQHQRKRQSCRTLYNYEGDIFNYDRSQEDVGLTCELELYRRLGLNESTLHRWSETHGVKKATSMMLGIVIWIAQQGLSGIFKTLFRNGAICTMAVLVSCELMREDIITFSVKGDDFLLELNRKLDVSRSVESLTLTFNLSSKFYGVDVMYFCSKYLLFVDGYWYWVVDPVRRVESVSASIACDGIRDVLSEKWISLRDDLRHYDNGLVMEALAAAVKTRMNLRFEPFGLIYGLCTLASDKQQFMDYYGPETRIG